MKCPKCDNACDMLLLKKSFPEPYYKSKNNKCKYELRFGLFVGRNIPDKGWENTFNRQFAMVISKEWVDACLDIYLNFDLGLAYLVKQSWLPNSPALLIKRLKKSLISKKPGDKIYLSSKKELFIACKLEDFYIYFPSFRAPEYRWHIAGGLINGNRDYKFCSLKISIPKILDTKPFLDVKICKESKEKIIAVVSYRGGIVINKFDLKGKMLFCGGHPNYSKYFDKVCIIDENTFITCARDRENNTTIEKWRIRRDGQLIFQRKYKLNGVCQDIQILEVQKRTSHFGFEKKIRLLTGDQKIIELSLDLKEQRKYSLKYCFEKARLDGENLILIDETRKPVFQLRTWRSKPGPETNLKMKSSPDHFCANEKYLAYYDERKKRIHVVPQTTNGRNRTFTLPVEIFGLEFLDDNLLMCLSEYRIHVYDLTNHYSAKPRAISRVINMLYSEDPRTEKRNYPVLYSNKTIYYLQA